MIIITKILTVGRRDLEDLWEKSDILTHYSRNHHPFLVFVEKGDKIEVRIYKHLNELIKSNLPANTRIMVQWKGNWKSDFFHFSFEELIKAYYEKYPKDDNLKMKEYYKQYEKETGKKAIRGGLETKLFQQWYFFKKESESR